MGAMNKNMNLPKLQQIMREFERQNERMEMSSEMMGDAVDDAFEVSRAPSIALGSQLRLG
jgi:charged multivesicular body protein 2A